jgi:hypothetical protein
MVLYQIFKKEALQYTLAAITHPFTILKNLRKASLHNFNLLVLR